MSAVRCDAEERHAHSPYRRWWSLLLASSSNVTDELRLLEKCRGCQGYSSRKGSSSSSCFSFGSDPCTDISHTTSPSIADVSQIPTPGQVSMMPMVHRARPLEPMVEHLGKPCRPLGLHPVPSTIYPLSTQERPTALRTHHNLVPWLAFRMGHLHLQEAEATIKMPLPTRRGPVEHSSSETSR